MKNVLDEHVIAYEGQNLYDYDNNILLNWYPKRVMDLVENAKSLLELGLGHGFAANAFSEQFGRHVILEGSPAVIENFKNNSPHADAEIVEIYFEEFETDERFDVIVMGFILEHVDDPVQIVSRFRKFLAPGGKMFLAVPNAEVLNRRLGHLAGMLPDMEALSDNDRMLGHKRYYTVDSLKNEVVGAGYAIERIEGIYLKPFTTGQIVSLGLDAQIIDALCKVGIAYPELSCGIFVQLRVVE